MPENPIKVLLVEDNQDYAWMLQLVLTEGDNEQFTLTHAGDLAEAQTCLGQQAYDVILLDLSLPDSAGFATFERTRDSAPDVPIVVMTAVNDKELALKAVREGAQDYLVKSDMDVTQLVRSVEYAVERHRTVQDLKRLSLIDDLTGLLNRRGFLSFGEQHLKIAQRAGRELLLFFTDLDGLKQINDHFGHPEGDQALRAVAAILKDTFRSSDIIARIGGDEFTILAIDAPEQTADHILARLQYNLNRHNRANPRYVLAMSIGVARFRVQESTELEDMLERADRSLYDDKQKKHINVIKLQV